MFHRFHRPVVCWICFLLFVQFSFVSRSTIAGALTSRDSRYAGVADLIGSGSLRDPFHSFEDATPEQSSTKLHDLFFHLYGWGAMDTIGVAYGTEAPGDPAELSASLKAAQPYSRMQLLLGRQRIFEGVTRDRVDGMKLSTGLGPWFSASAFGGLPFSLARSNGGTGDLIYGARIATHPRSLYEIGFSYQKLMDNSRELQENAGADITLKLGPRATLSGISTYSVDGRGWREHSYSALLKLDRLHIRPSYRFYQLDDHFENNSIENRLFGFLEENEEIVNIAGTDVLWRGFGPLQVGVRGRQYNYKLREENALYFAGLLNLTSPGGNRFELEVGRMEGQTPENRYSLFRCNFYRRNFFHMSGSFFSADALYMDYDQPINGNQGALHASVNTGLRMMDEMLETKLSAFYSEDPYFGGDVGALASFRLRF